MKLYFDIETLPAPQDKENLLREVFESKGRRSSFDYFVRGTSLSGNFGRILCVGLAIDDSSVKTLSGRERDILAEFWKIASEATQFIGHNIANFDLPFIKKRSIIHGIKPAVVFAEPLSSNSLIFDTMREWDGWGNRGTSLDHLTKILDLPSPKTEMTGREVWDYYRAGRESEIYDYCSRDVEAVRRIHKKLTFSTQPAQVESLT